MCFENDSSRLSPTSYWWLGPKSRNYRVLPILDCKGCAGPSYMCRGNGGLVDIVLVSEEF